VCIWIVLGKIYNQSQTSHYAIGDPRGHIHYAGHHQALLFIVVTFGFAAIADHLVNDTSIASIIYRRKVSLKRRAGFS